MLCSSDREQPKTPCVRKCFVTEVLNLSHQIAFLVYSGAANYRGGKVRSLRNQVSIYFSSGDSSTELTHRTEARQ